MTDTNITKCGGNTAMSFKIGNKKMLKKYN